MSAIRDMIGKKVGEYVEDKVKDALGFGDKDEDEKEKEKGGGIFSFFRGDKKEEEDKGGLFSFGGEKKKDEDKGGFFSKIFDRDDDDDDDGRKEKKAGFAGLFSEQQAGGADAGGEGESAGGSGLSLGVNDGDLFNDLMEVAAEKSQE
ncbi:sodium/potassium/calcium exchanger 1 [Hippoglossus stenolepis]|uniref:sodium/potassium/calcium exchanger 1 n=1 Tax=Hippoglossus stenolepis TaxID=195615 RepID=UPI00159C22A7|nr:sodium/potassium/calcium exchanger 1 [Hippoglossus stenolepis]